MIWARRRSLVALVSLAMAASASAHDFWIHASDYRPAVGERVDLTLHVGQHFKGDTLPRLDDWIVRFDYHDATGLHPVPGELGDDPAGYLLAVDGITLVAYQSQPNTVELKPAKFHSYLQDEGLEWVIEERKRRGEQDQPVKEWYTRDAKALIAPKDVAGGGWAYRFGLPLELVPLKDPYRLGAGEALPIQLLYQGAGLPDVLVVAYRDKAPEHKIRARTDADGKVELLLEGEGVWLVKAVHMIRAPESDEGYQWGSFWASLTFERQN